MAGDSATAYKHPQERGLPEAPRYDRLDADAAQRRLPLARASPVAGAEPRPRTADPVRGVAAAVVVLQGLEAGARGGRLWDRGGRQGNVERAADAELAGGGWAGGGSRGCQGEWRRQAERNAGRAAGVDLTSCRARCGGGHALAREPILQVREHGVVVC
jgi:hypothetical protein